MFGVFKESPSSDRKEILFTPGGAVQNEVVKLLDLSFEFLQAHEEELVAMYGGKTFGLLLVRSLEKETVFHNTPFRIPEFLSIPTNFYETNEYREVNENDLQGLETLISELRGFSFGTQVSKEIQKQVESYIGYAGAIHNKSIRHGKSDKRFVFQNLPDKNEIFYRESGFRYVWYKDFRLWTFQKFLEENPNILEHLRKESGKATFGSEFQSLLDFFDENTDEMNNTTLGEFLEKLSSEYKPIDFTPAQEAYLSQVFKHFAEVPCIAIRSSADTEDGNERNLPGVFYTGFCLTTDFNSFRAEVKKVLGSAKGVEGTKMGIIIMEVPGTKEESADGSWFFYPDGGGVMATTHFGDRVTISAEYGMPVGITSGENHESRTIDFNKDGGVLQIRSEEYSKYETVVSGKTALNSHGQQQELFDPNNLNRLETGIFGIFSKEIYQQLVSLGKKLEQRFGYPLDIEFAINNGEIFILQVRRFLDKYTRPDDMKKPDLTGKEVMLEGEDVLSGLGFLNNQELNFYRVGCDYVLNFYRVGCDYVWSRLAEQRKYEKETILQKLQSLEALGVQYALVMNKVDVFPTIQREKFPGLTLIVMKNNRNYRLSHAYMMLRELGIPTIMYDDTKNIMQEDMLATVYLDGNNGGVIYR